MGGARERERKGWNPVVSRSKRATPATTTTVQIRLGYIMDERESSFRATSKTRIFFFFFQKSPYLYYINSSVKERWKKMVEYRLQYVQLSSEKKKQTHGTSLRGF
jgi:uncharacterized protein (DUF2461 family)